MDSERIARTDRLPVSSNAAGHRSSDIYKVSDFAYVGCYTSRERNGRGEGITVYQIDKSGVWHQIQLYKSINPSWLLLDRYHQFLYAAHGDGERISSFAIDKNSGKLVFLNEQPAQGKNGVAMAVDPDNRYIIVANYSSGNVAVLPIYQGGALGPVCAFIQLPDGRGPHPTQQASSHPHHVHFNSTGEFIFVPDKGLDRIYIYRFDKESGQLIENHPSFVTTHSGAGPRHLAFYPYRPYIYVANELDSTVTTYQIDAASGELKSIQVIATLPANFTADSVCAEIAVVPSGNYVYVSNRGHDSISMFRVNQDTGMLTALGWQSTQGKTPRFFTIDPCCNMLYAANQDSDSIVAFHIKKDGMLEPTGQVIKSASPSNIVFARRPLPINSYRY